MNRKTAAEISVLIGVLAFFIGGLVNYRKDITDILLSAVVVGVTVFFMSFFAISLVHKEDIEEADKKEEEKYGIFDASADAPAKEKTGNSDKNRTKERKGSRLDVKAGKDDLEDLFK